MAAAIRKALPRAAASPRAGGSREQVLIDAALDPFASYGYRGAWLARTARAAGDFLRRWSKPQ